MKFALLAPVAALALAPAYAQESHPTDADNLVVYQESGRFAGWPANHGIWSWGDEILVGFERGYFKDNESIHDIDYFRPAEHVLARSLDGGRNWAIEQPASLQPPPDTKVANVPLGQATRPIPLAVRQIRPFLRVHHPA